MKPLRLLFITPKIHEGDDEFSFTSLWAKAFANAGFEVTVICMSKGTTTLPFPVHSLGVEKGWSRVKSLLYFQKLILTIPYDRVFVHMNPRWLAAGAWYWWLRRIPTYLWYTHYTQPFSLKWGAKILKRMFGAMPGSLPQYDGDPRKIVTGHGIDTEFWKMPDVPTEAREPKEHLLAVHRISRSKKLDLVLRALLLLPPEYTLTHYGRAQDPRIDQAYEQEVRTIAADPKLAGRVHLMGSVPTTELRNVYSRYQVTVNMVPATIDKTVLEGMYSGGLTPVVARDQAAGIGDLDAPADETPEAVAAYIQKMVVRPREEIREIVMKRHSLVALVEKMAVYIRDGR